MQRYCLKVRIDIVNRNHINSYIVFVYQYSVTRYQRLRLYLNNFIIAIPFESFH